MQPGPTTLESLDELVALVAFAARHNYEVCESPELEAGFEKLAIYERRGEPTHVALQLSDGRWSSKLGSWEDIAHASLAALRGRYGEPAIYLRRPRA